MINLEKNFLIKKKVDLNTGKGWNFPMMNGLG